MRTQTEGMQGMLEYLSPLVEERIDRPGDDFVSVVASGEKRGIFTRHQVLVNCSLLLLAGRPVLDQLNDHRWRTGAPLDPRVRWLSAPSVEDSEAAWSWARVNMMLGAARIRRERIQLADTWTFITVACFLLWTAAVLLGA